MENQHRKISGYRELSQKEIDLMNEIKQKGQELQELCNKITIHIDKQHDNLDDDEEFNRLAFSSPYSWLNSGVHDLQTGLTKITRAVAQPESF